MFGPCLTLFSSSSLSLSLSLCIPHTPYDAPTSSIFDADWCLQIGACNPGRLTSTDLGGNDNYRILDCDLLGTAIIIHTGGSEEGGSATNGYIARNMLWNANAAHWFDGIKQVRMNVLGSFGARLGGAVKMLGEEGGGGGR